MIPKPAVVLSFLSGVIASAGICLIAQPAGGQPSRPSGPPSALSKKAQKLDGYGDPLPESAVARLGTVRWRHGETITFVAFLPDGKSILTGCQDQIIRLWDVKTGREIRRFGKPPSPAADEAGPFVLGGRFRSATRAAMPFHASLSADGKLLASGSQDSTIRLWQVETGKEIAKIDGPGLKLPGGGAIVGVPGLGVTNLVLAPDGKTLAGTALNGAIHLWDTATGNEIRQINQAENQNMPVALGGLFGPLVFSPDSKSILDSSLEIGNANQTGSLRLWDVATGKKRFEIEDKKGGIGTLSAAFSPDGKILACTDFQGSIRLLNAQTGEELRQLKETNSWCQLLFSPDSKTLVWQDNSDHSTRLWDVQTGKELRTLVKASASSVFSDARRGFANLKGRLAFSPDGKILAMAHNHALRLVDVTSGQDLNPLEGNQSTVSRVDFSSDGKSLITRSDDGTLREWEIAGGRERRKIPLSLWPGTQAFDLSSDGKTLATGQINNQIDIWDAAKNKKLHSIDGEKIGFSALAFSPDSKVLAVREMVSPLVHLHDASTGREIRRLEEPPKGEAANQGLLPFTFMNSVGLVFSPSGEKLAASIDGKTLGVWNVSTGKLLGRIEVSEIKPPLALAFSPDSRTLALATEDDAVSLWEIAAAQVRRHLGKKPEAAQAFPNMVFRMPAGIAGAGMPVMSFYSEAAKSLTFSPDGKLLCQGRSDQKITIWETATGRRLGRLRGHQGEIRSLAFSPDGKQLASGSADTTALIWDPAELLAPWQEAPEDISDRQVEAAWANLADRDTAKAYESVCLLSAAPKSALNFLQKNLRPTQAIDAATIDKWITQLDDNQFAVRQKASAELERLGELAVPAVRKALKGKPSLEARKRLEQLLSAGDSRTNLTADRLRTLRAIEVLEQIGTPEARQLLQTLADGAAGALQTEEAKESLQRLRRQKK